MNIEETIKYCLLKGYNLEKTKKIVCLENKVILKIAHKILKGVDKE